LRYSPSR